MSIIHEALQSKRQRNPDEEETQIVEEGLFLGKKALVIEPKWTWPKLKPYILGLSGLVVVGILFLVLPKAWTFISDLIPDSTTVAISEDPPKVEPEKPKKPEKPQAQVDPLPVKKNPQPVSVSSNQNINEANAFFQEKKYDESLKIYRNLLQQGEVSAEIYNNLGMIYLKKELYSISENYFSKSLEINTECGSCFNNLGYLKTLVGNHAEAEKYLQKALEYEGNQPEILFNMAVMFEKSGKILKAVKYYSEFIELGKVNFSPDMVNDVRNRVEELTGQDY